jgi:putative acetyltransferase
MFRWGKEAGAIRRGAVPGRGFWFGQEIHLEVDIFPNGNTISTPMADLPKQRAHLQIGTSSGRIGAYEIRRAQSSDVGEIASAHRDSIQSLGPKFYSPELLEYWQEGITGELYLKAMEAGEVFFVAVGEADGSRVVLGFASDYRVAGPKHGTSVYVRGDSARRGVGSALLAAAEAHAVSNGATSLEIEASLAGAAFYKASGFVEVGRGETRLTTGRSIECVFMRKDLSLIG